MKLQNKKTGEIRTAEAREDGIYLYNEITEQWYKYELDLLAKGWEYYEEPKEFYYITVDGYVVKDNDTITKNFADDLESIGNYFETEEEAEKAVEKLKAWKRLKDKGFKFRGCHFENECFGDLICCDTDEYIKVGSEEYKRIQEDYDFLFGGEE
jgi:hypothetical protein